MCTAITFHSKDFYFGFRSFVPSISLQSKMIIKGAFLALITFFLGSIVMSVLMMIIIQMNYPDVAEALKNFLK